MHLEAGLPNPLEKNWYVATILKGVRRVKGDASVQKLPITPDILKQIFLTLDLHSSLDRTFWATCLVGFFSFFRKSNLLVSSHMVFDPTQNLCANNVRFTVKGAVLAVRWSEVIQLREHILHIPIPKIPDSPLCPSTALLRLTLESLACSHPLPLFWYAWMGAANVPLTQHRFTEKFQACLNAIGLDASKYTWHSLHRGGASFALQCGLPVDLIKVQGDWRSNACDRYLEPSFELWKQVARQMGEFCSFFFLIMGVDHLPGWGWHTIGFICHMHLWSPHVESIALQKILFVVCTICHLSFFFVFFFVCAYVLYCYSHTSQHFVCHLMHVILFYVYRFPTSTSFGDWRYIVENFWTSLEGPVRKSFFLNHNMLHFHFHLCNCLIIVHVLKKFSIIWFLFPKDMISVSLCFPLRLQASWDCAFPWLGNTWQVTLNLDGVAHFRWE